MKRKSLSHQVAKSPRLLAILLMVLISLPLIANSQQPTANNQNPLWMRYNSISPKGDKIAFAYKGDIYVVDSEGGLARQLTTNSSYDSSPIWSNDGKYIAFATDRNANFDIYVVSVDGGVAKRVTTNSVSETPLAFSADNSMIYYSANIQKDADNVQFPTGWMRELYKVSVDGGRPTQVVAVNVCSISFDNDGESFLYYDQKGGEDKWRKHQISSVARDIVYYDAKEKTHTILTSNIGEDRDPRFLPGKEEMVFLSEGEGGNFNVYKAKVNDVNNAQKITDFPTYPVRFLSVSDNGLLCYGYQGEIYTQTLDGEPKKVEIQIVNDQEETTEMGKFGKASDIT
ncbi:MAG: PD40 domain-containing protein, partial [Bacteroidales bacterium]|nr:PD40 domain-containing protein [Bacteroidales bacterium]